MKNTFLLTIILMSQSLWAQKNDSLLIRSIYDEALTNSVSYEWLETLCKKIGSRLSGSDEAAKAVAFTKQIMENEKFDTVYLQEVMVPHWVRGSKESCVLSSEKLSTIKLSACALGNSIGTEGKDLSAEIVIVNDFKELALLGEKNIKGKMVFFNKAFDEKLINTFGAYGGCVSYRFNGAVEAAKYGAVAVLVRSMSHENDPHPHTGSMGYQTDYAQIPGMAISTKDAEKLVQYLKTDSKLKITINMDCKMYGEVLSYNVIGEIKGSKKPNEIIAVGGHLDSWDKGEGAHDDGAGCMHSIEALRILKIIGYQPERTLRVVLFMNEENGLKGALKYAEIAQKSGQINFAAIESDRGGFTPRGFTFDTNDEKKLATFKSFRKHLEPYGLHFFEKGGSGADVGQLKSLGTNLFGFIPDSQRYFNHHHAETDNFETVNKRELQLGSASIASLIYLLDKYGNEFGF